MTDPVAPKPFDEFWTARQQHKLDVANAFRAVMDTIALGEANGLYEDGLPQPLAEARAVAMHRSATLDPASTSPTGATLTPPLI